MKAMNRHGSKPSDFPARAVSRGPFAAGRALASDAARGARVRLANIEIDPDPPVRGCRRSGRAGVSRYLTVRVGYFAPILRCGDPQPADPARSRRRMAARPVGRITRRRQRRQPCDPRYRANGGHPWRNADVRSSMRALDIESAPRRPRRSAWRFGARSCVDGYVHQIKNGIRRSSAPAGIASLCPDGDATDSHGGTAPSVIIAGTRARVVRVPSRECLCSGLASTAPLRPLPTGQMRVPRRPFGSWMAGRRS